MELQVSVCSGYELTADLDFDTDGDGDIDSNDDYWNSGAGWLPLSNFSSGNVFTATLEGNGHVIDNLFMNITIPSSGLQEVGFFNKTGSAAVIRNLGLTNVDMTATPAVTDYRTAFMYAGALAGENSGTVSGVFVTGKVSAANVGRVGGLDGSHGSKIRNSYAMVRVTGGTGTGGLAGNGVPIASYATGTVMGVDATANPTWNLGALLGSGAATASYATGRVWTSGTFRSGGLVGQGCGGTLPDCADSYWDSTTSGLETSTPHGVSRTTAQLQAPTGYSGIYAGWNVDVDGDDASDDPWDFGTSAQYPALKVDGVDGDGTATWQEFGLAAPRGPDPDDDAVRGDAGPLDAAGQPELDGGGREPLESGADGHVQRLPQRRHDPGDRRGGHQHAQLRRYQHHRGQHLFVPGGGRGRGRRGGAQRVARVDGSRGRAALPRGAAAGSGADAGRGAGNGGHRPRRGVHGSRRPDVDLRGGGERQRGAVRLHRRDFAAPVGARGRPRDRDRHGRGPRRPERDAGLRRHAPGGNAGPRHRQRQPDRRHHPGPARRPAARPRRRRRPRARFLAVVLRGVPRGRAGHGLCGRLRRLRADGGSGLRHQRQRRPRRRRRLLVRRRRLGAHRQRVGPVRHRARGQLARRLERVHRPRHAGRRGPVRSRGRGRKHPPLRGRRRFRDGERPRRRPGGGATTARSSGASPRAQ